jgi:hypothetical protein
MSKEGENDPNVLAKLLVDYETKIRTDAGGVVLHSPPTAAENQRLADLRAAYAQQEYAIYLDELKRIKAERDARLLSTTGVYSGAATVDLYEQYVGAPVKEMADYLKEDHPQLISNMINFIPVIGQLKGIAEAIIGRDLITGDELPAWERGLNILLAIIPEAHGFFSAGEGGVRGLARVAADVGEPADKVFRTVKAASRLTVDEVQAAERVVARAPPTRAQVKLARSLEEMDGTAAAGPAVTEAAEKDGATGAKALATELEQVTQPTRLAGKQHALSLKRVGGRISAWLCSDGCGELIEKAEAMLARLPETSAARAELSKFIDQVRKEASCIDKVPSAAEAEQELATLERRLEAIDAHYPHVIDPDIPVAPQRRYVSPPAKAQAAAPAAPVRLAAGEVAQLQQRFEAIANKRVIVGVQVKVTVRGDPVVVGLKSEPFEAFHTSRGVGGTGRAATLPQVSKPLGTAGKAGTFQPVGGIVVEPAANSQTLEVLAYNTGDRVGLFQCVARGTTSHRLSGRSERNLARPGRLRGSRRHRSRDLRPMRRLHRGFAESDFRSAKEGRVAGYSLQLGTR